MRRRVERNARVVEVEDEDEEGEEEEDLVLVLAEPSAGSVGPGFELEDGEEDRVLAEEVDQGLLLVGRVVGLEHVVAHTAGLLDVGDDELAGGGG